MFHYNNRKPNQPLVKIKSSYDKLQKTLNEPAREYNAIKELVETQDNRITNIKNIKNNDLKNKDITVMGLKTPQGKAVMTSKQKKEK